LILDADFVPGQSAQVQNSSAEGPVVKSAFAALLGDQEDDEDDEDDDRWRSRAAFSHALHSKFSPGALLRQSSYSQPSLPSRFRTPPRARYAERNLTS
jgi:hypothetical protein